MATAAPPVLHQEMRRGLAGHLEPDAPVQLRGSVLPQHLEPHGNPARLGTLDRPLQNGGPDTAALRARMDGQHVDVHVVRPILDVAVAGGCAVPQDQLDPSAVPLRREEPGLLGIAPAAELPLHDLAERRMVELANQLAVGRKGGARRLSQPPPHLPVETRVGSLAVMSPAGPPASFSLP